MINIDSIALESFLKENKDFFTNAKVQKIQQPTRKELILHVRNAGASKKLYININPQFYHLAFMNKENEQRRSLKIPKQPPMFCMLLRKHMEGAKILRVSKPENERILELYFENYNEIGDRIEECLSIELMGKHSNVVLYNTDTNIIIGCAHNIGAEKSKERELAGGLPYIYPPKQNKKNLLVTKSASFIKTLQKSDVDIKRTLSENFFNLSQILAQEVCEKAQIPSQTMSAELKVEQMQILYIELFELLSKEQQIFFISKDFDKYSCIKNDGIQYDSPNELLDDYFSFHIEKFILNNLKTNLKNTVLKDLKKFKNNLKIQEKLLENKSKSKKYKLKADLIMANLYNLKEGDSKTILDNFEGTEKIEIEFDENISLIENANKYYAKYNKAKRAYGIALEFYEKTLKDMEYCEELLFSIEISTNVCELNEIEREIHPEKTAPKGKEKENQSIVQYIEINGFDVYIGKNNKQNDYIFSKISSPNDLWFHALNVPGAHILIKIPNEKSLPDNETLLKTAQLTKEYSSAKNSGKVSVIYTQKKYVKKPPSQKGGMVTYKNETEIVVE